jgi:hypothetical protein
MAFAHCPDYALAMLVFSERFRIDDIWIDSFTHCVGMKDMLHISSEVMVCNMYGTTGSGPLLIVYRDYHQQQNHSSRIVRYQWTAD